MDGLRARSTTVEAAIGTECDAIGATRGIVDQGFFTGILVYLEEQVAGDVMRAAP